MKYNNTNDEDRAKRRRVREDGAMKLVTFAGTGGARLGALEDGGRIVDFAAAGGGADPAHPASSAPARLLPMRGAAAAA
jgi:hypothetical protein